MSGITGLKQLYFGASDGQTYNIKDGTYKDKDETPIAIRIRTKNYYLSSPEIIDEIQQIFIFSDEPQATNVGISLDDGNYESLGSIQEKVEKFDVYKKCYRISLGFDEVSSNNIKIKGFNIYYEPQSEQN